MKPRADLETSIAIPLRFRDIDALGHVNNAVYLTFLEAARVAYYQKAVGISEPEDFMVVIARVEIDYLAPIRLTDQVVCAIGVTRWGRSSFVFEYELSSPVTGVRFAKAQSVQVGFDFQRQETMPLDRRFTDAVLRMRTESGLQPPEKKSK